MEFIEVNTPQSVLDKIAKAEEIIGNLPESSEMRTRISTLEWHTSLSRPNRMGAMYLLAYNDYNEFFELSIFPNDYIEIRLYGEFDNSWELLYPESEEED